MTTDRLPWELGKYAVIMVCVVAMVRLRGLQPLIVPLLFFFALLPSAVLTVSDFPLEEARQQISFNLSGPLALVMCAGFFHLTRPSGAQLQNMLLALVAPVVGIAAAVLYGIVTTPDNAFNTESNIATSGGFGPNQVSAMLGLGALCALFCLVTTSGAWPFRALMFAVMSWLATQSALTFSRGGLFAAGGAAAVTLLCLIREPRLRQRVAFVAVLVFLMGRYVVWPRLDEFTGGTITARFAETDLARRDDVGSEDLAAWYENPVFGIGPGRSALVHDEQIIAHTEFTRLLAEHGSLGAFSIAAMLLLSVRTVRHAGSSRTQALVLGMIAWSCLFMLNSAMRTAAPAFMFGLAFARMEPPVRPSLMPQRGTLSRRVLAVARRRVLARS
jgi:hypothetical protein